MNNKGNIMISYLFQNDDIIKNIDFEHCMIADLQNLSETWKAKGYIKRYVIADDECISDRLKQ